MNESNILPDDPRLTAYALGELDPAETAAIEAALQSNPALRDIVAEIKGTAGRLEAAFAAEVSEHSRSSVIAGFPASPGPAPEQPGPANSRSYAESARGGKFIRFPLNYYLIGTAAAACFAFVVAFHEAPERVPAAPTYVAVEFPAMDGAGGGAPAEPAELALSRAVAEATGAERRAIQAPIVSEEVLVLNPFVIQEARDESFISNSVGSGSRLKLDLRDVPAAYSVINREFIDSLGITDLSEAAQWAPGQTFNGGRGGRVGMTPVPSAVRPVSPEPVGTETYESRVDNRFTPVARAPLSTFSIDVDTAGYSNVRRYLLSNQLPPRDAVRVEEMINYFPYRYAAPTGDVPFAATLEVASAPWDSQRRLVRIGLKGREVSTAARPRANLVFLLDVSGSMAEPNKLPLVQESMRLLLEKLRSDDRVAIVVYAGASGLVLPSTAVSESAAILGAIDRLSAGGSTNGAQGIQLAYEVARANFVQDGVNRVILCTDGDFNVGITNRDDLIRLVEDRAKTNVFLTVLGFGMGNLKDATLEGLADKGNGQYGYIDNRREAEKMLVEQVSGTLVTIAKDVKIQVEFNPEQVASYRLIGYENRMLRAEDFNNDQIDAGEIGAGHTVTALYEIVPTSAGLRPVSAGEEGAPAVDELRYGRTAARPANASPADPLSQEMLTVKVRYKQPTGTESRKLEFPLTDRGTGFSAASADFRFAASVAGFGMALRGGSGPDRVLLADVMRWAEGAIDSRISPDPAGYRSEFLGLIRRAQSLVE